MKSRAPSGVEEPADLLCHLVTQDHVALQRRAAQIEVAVLHAQIVAAVRHLLDGEGRGLRLVQDAELRRGHLDVARGHLGILRRTLDHPPGDLKHVLAAQTGRRLPRLGRGALLDDDLRDAVAVAQVDEGHGAQVAHLLHPTRQRNGFIHVRGSQRAAGMCSVHVVWYVYFCYLCSCNLQRYEI